MPAVVSPRTGSVSGAARLRRRVRSRSAALKRIGLYYADAMAVDAGLRRGHRDYTRFIILGEGRTGTNFLRGLLNSHSRVIVHGELFRDFDVAHGGISRLLESKRALRLKRADPIGFIETAVFRKMPRNIGAVGFKIFHNHAQNEEWRPIWSHLRNDEDIRVIHMKRRNALATFLSFVRASASDKWVNAGLDGTAVHLNYDDCLAAFEQSQRWQDEYESFFTRDRMIEVEYEALAADHGTEMARVLELLKVEPQRLQPSTLKQSGQPLSEAIANYAELKERFTGSSWAVYFED